MLESFTNEYTGMWVKFFSRLTAIIAYFLNTTQYETIRSLCDPNSNETETYNNSILSAHVFIIQTNPHAENTSQISDCSTSVKGLFPLHVLTESNIPILSNQLQLPITVFKTNNTVLTYHSTVSYHVFYTIKLFCEKIWKTWFFTLTQSKQLCRKILTLIF